MRALGAASEGTARKLIEELFPKERGFELNEGEKTVDSE